MIQHLPPEAFVRLWQSRPEIVLVDVREPWEWAMVHIDNSQLLPLGQLPTHFAALPKDRPVALLCHHGVRSWQAAYFLQHQGFSQLFNIQGGIAAWADFDPTLPHY
jgi:rhodanese-related sulfurtransferase